MQREDILIEFKEAQAILNGHFILSSGLHSDTYLQCARVFMCAKRAEKLCRILADKIEQELGKNAFDIIVAPAMGGVVVGYEMGRQLGIEAIFCERENGKFALRRGFQIAKDARVLVVEDVVTTGKSSKEAIECIKQNGGKIIAEACLVDRSNEQYNLDVPLISLIKVKVKTFEKNNVPDNLKNVEAIKPGSRWLKDTASV